MVGHCAGHVRRDAENHGRTRRIEVEQRGSATDRALLVRIRSFAGSPAKRDRHAPVPDAPQRMPRDAAGLSTATGCTKPRASGSVTCSATTCVVLGAPFQASGGETLPPSQQ